MQRVYFFGVPASFRVGHRLCKPGSEVVVGWPFGGDEYFLGGMPIDGGFAQPRRPGDTTDEREPQSSARLHHVTDACGVLWTVIGMWDRSADDRSACNANFIIEGAHSFDEALLIAKVNFPLEVDRISRAAPIRLMTAARN